MFIGGKRMNRLFDLFVWLLFERLDLILATQQENQDKINGYVGELNDSLGKLTTEIKALKDANAALPVPEDQKLDFSGLDAVTTALDALEPPATPPVETDPTPPVTDPVDPAPVETPTEPETPVETTPDAPIEVVEPEAS